MKKKRFIPLLFAAMMLSTNFLSFATEISRNDVSLMATPSEASATAGETAFTEKNVLYQTFDQSDDPMEHLENPVILNGVPYNVTSVSEPKYVRKDSIKQDIITYTSEVWTGDGEEQKPKEELEENGKTYYLKTISKEAVKSEERTVNKDATIVYTGIEDGVHVPSERKISFKDEDTKQEVNANLPLKSEIVTKEYWSDDFEFPITISGYNANAYMLGDKEIPADADLINYASDFLKILSLNPDKYEITSITWDGGQYEEEGLIKRKAIGKGKKLVQDISAVYNGEVTLPETEGYIWKCEYTEKIPESQQTVYTMAVDVSYEQANAVATKTSFLDKLAAMALGVITAVYTALATSFKEHPVATSIPFVVFAGLIAFLITRKVRNRCMYDKMIKCPYKKHGTENCKTCQYFYKRGVASEDKKGFEKFKEEK